MSRLLNSDRVTCSILPEAAAIKWSKSIGHQASSCSCLLSCLWAVKSNHALDGWVLLSFNYFHKVLMHLNSTRERYYCYYYYTMCLQLVVAVVVVVVVTPAVVVVLASCELSLVRFQCTCIHDTRLQSLYFQFIIDIISSLFFVQPFSLLSSFK